MFWENFKKLCDSIGKKPNPVASELGFSSGNVTAWKNGRIPKWTNLQKIADYFQVSVEDLISSPDILIHSKNGNSYIVEDMTPNKQKEKTAETDSLSPIKQKILNNCSNLSEKELDDVLDYIEYKISQRKH